MWKWPKWGSRGRRVTSWRLWGSLVGGGAWGWDDEHGSELQRAGRGRTLVQEGPAGSGLWLGGGECVTAPVLLQAPGSSQRSGPCHRSLQLCPLAAQKPLRGPCCSCLCLELALAAVGPVGTRATGTTSPDHPDDRDASSSGEGVALSELPDAEGSGDGHDHRASLQEPAAAALPSPVSCPVPSQTAPGEARAGEIAGPRGTPAWPPPG